MSRSYRKPHAAVCGSDSAHDDKKHAARSVRAAHRQALRDLLKSGLYDEFLLPHRYECSFNDTYLWARDGGKHLHFDSNTDEWQHKWYLKLRANSSCRARPRSRTLPRSGRNQGSTPWPGTR